MLFDARVVGVRSYLREIRKREGRAAFRLETDKFASARELLVERGVIPNADALEPLMAGPDAATCHLFFERPRLLAPLRELVAELDGIDLERVRPGFFGERFPGILALGTSDALILPFTMLEPLWVEVPGRNHPLPLVSAPALQAELDFVQSGLEIEARYGRRRIGSFVRAPRHDIAKIADAHELDFDFWRAFGSLVLQTICDEVVAAQSAGIISDRAVAEPC